MHCEYTGFVWALVHGPKAEYTEPVRQTNDYKEIMMFEGPIRNIEDVRAFFAHLANTDRVSFHPDDNFSDYVSIENGEITFSDEQATHYNELMNVAFKVCEFNGVDIYELGMAELKGEGFE